MNYLRIVILVFFAAITGCDEQKSSPEAHWFKGNLHGHSYWSDGDEFPEVIMDWYKSNDYQFVVLSDHNTLATGDKWIKIRQDSLYQNAFKNYLESYGPEWVNYKSDSMGQTLVKLKTYKEYKKLFEENGKFLMIQSEEISDHYGDKPLHMNATNIQEKIDPQGGNSVMEVLQNNIDAVVRQRNELNVPMIAHVNHPNFGNAINLEDMIGLKGERFFEVYNGHPAVNNSGNSKRISTEAMWDLINIAYIENEKPLMYGLATDDSHHYHKEGTKWSNAGRGWIMVKTDSLNPRSIIEAMEAGQFYASTGVEIAHLTTGKQSISVEVKEETGVSYEISFIGCKKGKGEAEELISITGNKATFKITDEMLFVRCKITSSKLQKNPIENLLYETAWTQPVLGQ